MLENMVMHDMRDKMEEECGVFAVYSPTPVTNLQDIAYYGIFSLQHRGQESAGLSIYCVDEKIRSFKEMGMVNEVFAQFKPITHEAKGAISHVRYSTTGRSRAINAQPLSGETRAGYIALAHNGNLVNAKFLKRKLENYGTVFQTTTDTEVILSIVARKSRFGYEKAIKETCNIIKGGFALVVLMEGKLIGVRDPLALRPLCLGIIEKTGAYILASESCALDAVGAKYVRDIEAGEMVVIDDDGVRSIMYAPEPQKKSCSFEYIYFARPDSVIDGMDVYDVRYKAGEYLYKHTHVDADIVIGVPDSGIAAAIGYSEASGIPYGMGLMRNKYIGRSFILPSQELREKTVRLKLSTINPVIRGKRLIVVDDSLVRGTTAKSIVNLLRENGAKEVHFRLASPIVKSECYFGVDMASKKDLIGAVRTLEEIRAEIGADSVAYLSVDQQAEILGGSGLCMGCFTGEYPIKDIEN